tara:strand:- start:3403 stop:7143 length:3741 start_codon:yes stop_codon:yes gene_type:complete
VNKTYKNILNPNNFKVDDREILDFIILIKEYSKKVNFYNNKNKIDGSWYELLKSDETFLIAEISKFEISNFTVNRLELIKRYDVALSLEVKKLIFNEFYNSALALFEQINEWYLEALKNNLTQQSSLIELELEIAIQKTLSPLLKEFIIISKSFSEKNFIDDSINEKLAVFNSIWKVETPSFERNFERIEFNENELNHAFKKITLIFNPTYEIIYNLIIKSKKIFTKSLYENDNHKAHVGLIFSFLELIKHSYEDLNKITKKHLDLYFKKILKLKHYPASPNKIFISLEIDENIDGLTIPKNTYLKAGQSDDGNDILFSTDEEIELNNVLLNHISTFFLSENKVYDHHSRFNLISGLYSKTHASSEDEVAEFNKDKTYFSTLGEEQLFHSEEEMNMNKSDIGFMILSPVLALSKSNRTIDIDFEFTIDSIKTLSDLIIDISQNKDSSEEAVFNEIFSDAFIIEYTSEQGWINIHSYKVLSPSDWSTGVIRISFDLDKTFPDIVSFDSDLHNLQLDSDLPILKFKINQECFYNPYSFLNNMQVSKIDLRVKVKNLKKFNCYVNNEEVDIKSEFELFGATPKRGSNLIIGSDELFNKKISALSVNWEYTNLNTLNNSLKEFYKEYEMDIKNDSFKVQVSALSNFNYSKIKGTDLIYNLFEENEEGQLTSLSNINKINVDKLDIRPNYKLKLADLYEYSNDLETGYLKFELVEPSFGFGFDIFDKVLNRASQKALSQKPKKDLSLILENPNEPFSPMISELSVNYEAHSSLFFNQLLFSQNDFDQENSFYLISPFGIEKTFSKKLVSKNTLVESFKYEGELILGFKSFKPPFQVNLLFEILKSENQNYEFNRQIDWYYSSVDGWKLFKKGDVLQDQTQNLMKTGVLSLKIPTDISDKNQVFNEKKIYIKACSKNKSNQFSSIRSINTNSVSATEVLNESISRKSINIPPESVQGFITPIDGVIAMKQNLGSFNGLDIESDIDFYVRSSELLRHKNRPVTKWDVEKFVLAKFSWLSHVKCYSINKKNNQLRLLCVKKIEAHQNIDNIKISSAEKDEIKNYLEKFTSPFSKFEIINPVFEDLWIKCKVSFQNIANGKGIQKLQADFFNFICSWLYDSSNKNRIGLKIKKLDIINFLNNRTYISFITGISIIHIKKLENGEQVAFDSAQTNTNNEFIEPGVPWALFIPRKNHKIEVLQKNEYHAPEPIDFNELGIQESFLINSDSRSTIENNDNLKIKQIPSESKFNFKLKI